MVYVEEIIGKTYGHVNCGSIVYSIKKTITANNPDPSILGFTVGRSETTSTMLHANICLSWELALNATEFALVPSSKKAMEECHAN